MLFVAFSDYENVSDSANVYSGIIEGDDHGIWTAIIESTGYTKIIYYSIDHFTMDGIMGYLIDTKNNISTATAINGTLINARVHSSGDIYGSWSGIDSAHGSLYAMKQTATAQYAGTYSGTFPGKDLLTWTMRIDNYGRTFGTRTNSTIKSSANFTGGVDDYGGGRVLGDGGIASFFISGNDVNGVLFDEHGYSIDSFTGTKQTTVKSTMHQSG